MLMKKTFRFLSLLVLLMMVATGAWAVKKAPVSLIVNPALGQIIGDDGKNHAANDLPAGVKAVATPIRRPTPTASSTRYCAAPAT